MKKIRQIEANCLIISISSLKADVNFNQKSMSGVLVSSAN